MTVSHAIIRRRLIRLIRSGRYPRLTSSDFLYIGLSLVIGFGLGARVVGQAARSTVESVRAAEQVTPTPRPTASPAPDPRVKRIAAFLDEHHSPLAPYAALIIHEADRYDIGWTKVVAIAGMESGFGTRQPEGSHNAWGLGGTKLKYFATWTESIHYMSALLGNKYKRTEVDAVQNTYCPDSECNPEWTNIVLDVSNNILSQRP